MSRGGWKRQRLAAVVAWLRQNHHTPHPVQLQLRRLPGRDIHRTDGVTVLKGRVIYIFIDSRLTWPEMLDVLMHEWAHAMDWRHYSLENRRLADHTDEWGLYYARIYRDIKDLGALDP